jgi:hypothetical protein
MGSRTAALLPVASRLVAAAALSCAVPLCALAAERWKWDAEITATAEYDSNVFNLDGDGQDRVENESAVDRATGRTRDMDSVNDVATAVRFEATARRDTEIGRLSISPRAGYRYYLENTEKAFPELGVRIRQSFGEGAALELDLDYEVGVFKKNYLKGTRSADAVIAASERVYDRGIHDDFAVGLQYERPLWRSRESPAWLRRLTGELALGYSARRFENGFSNRDLDTWRAGVKLDARLGESVGLAIDYAVAAVRADGDEEVSILDESDVAADLNADGDRGDDDLRTLTEVDRSRVDHSLGIELEADLLRRLRASLGYRYTLRDYTSNGPLDIAHNGREDQEGALQLGLRWAFAKRWQANLEGELGWTDPNKDAAVIDDEDSKRRRRMLRLAIGREF